MTCDIWHMTYDMRRTWMEMSWILTRPGSGQSLRNLKVSMVAGCVLYSTPLITRVSWHCERDFPKDCSHVLRISTLFSRCARSIRSHKITLGNWSQSSWAALFTASSSCEWTKSSRRPITTNHWHEKTHGTGANLGSHGEPLACYSHFTSCVTYCEVMYSWTWSCPWQFSITLPLHQRLSLSPKKN